MAALMYLPQEVYQRCLEADDQVCIRVDGSETVRTSVGDVTRRDWPFEVSIPERRVVDSVMVEDGSALVTTLLDLWTNNRELLRGEGPVEYDGGRYVHVIPHEDGSRSIGVSDFSGQPQPEKRRVGPSPNASDKSPIGMSAHDLMVSDADVVPDSDYFGPRF